MILHIISDFTRGDGAQNMLARLLRVTRDERILLVSMLGVSESMRAAVGNSRVHYVALGLRTPLTAPAAALRLVRMIRAERPSAVLCWMYHAMPVGLVAAKMAGTGTPVYWTIRQALDDPSALTASTRRAIRLARRMSPFSSGILYNSQRGREQHAAFGFADANAVVIPNGFDLPSICPPVPRMAKVFGVAGRLHPQKDHGTFFRAAAAVARERPDTRFVLAGPGMSRGAPEVDAVLARAGLSPDRVELRGRVANMAAFYAEIDVLVLSSLTEGFPNVAAEAMSFGKPVVSTDVGDAATIIGEAGRIVPPRDAVALGRAMVEMLELPPEAYRAMACAARARIERHYALPAIAAAYDAFLLQQRSGRIADQLPPTPDAVPDHETSDRLIQRDA